MIEMRGNIWDHLGAGFICITTNGFVKRNGECVMGRGIARDAARRFPDLPSQLGWRISSCGNHVYRFNFERGDILTFPVKVNWWEPAQPWLIEQSCKELLAFLDHLHESVGVKAFIPRAGCGNGQLDWMKDVKPIFERCFGDDPRIVVVDRVATLEPTVAAEKKA